MSPWNTLNKTTVMESQAFPKKGHDVAWGQSAWDLSTCKHNRSNWNRASLAFQEMDQRFNVQTLKNQHAVTELPCPSPCWKKSALADWSLVAIQILTTPHHWAKNQKISCKNHNIFIWTFLQCSIIAGITIKSSWASQKARVLLSFCPSWKAEAVLCTYSQCPTPITRNAEQLQHLTHNEKRWNNEAIYI